MGFDQVVELATKMVSSHGLAANFFRNNHGYSKT
jgi:hypothetical protein